MSSNLDYRLQVMEIIKEDSPQLAHQFYINCRPVDSMTGGGQLEAINEAVFKMVRDTKASADERRRCIQALDGLDDFFEWEDRFIMQVLPLLYH